MKRKQQVIKKSIALSILLGTLSACGGSDSIEETIDEVIDDIVNDPAVISGTTSTSISSDSDTISYTLNITDTDSGEALFNAQSTDTDYGSFSISESGAWTYSINTENADIIALTSSTTVTDTITITSVDGTTSNIVITIAGIDTSSNTPATFSGDYTTTVAFDSSTPVTGTLTVTDTDTDEDEVTAETQTTTYGSFTIDAQGAWTYTLDTANTTVSGLANNTILTDTIAVTSVDGTSTNISITINGPVEVVAVGGDDTVPDIVCTSVVSSISALEDAADNVVAGDTLCLADGTYTGDLELRVEGVGTADNPITIAAENSGGAIITGGEVSVNLGGEYVVLQGFVFRDGTSPSSIIKLKKSTECSYCRITEVSVIDMDGGEFDSSTWVDYYGQYNRIDHNWFSGKEGRGVMLKLGRWTDGDVYPEDHAQIDHNYFGDRAPAWGRGYAGSSDNEYEGIRLGLSTTHQDPSYSTVEYNYFERIQGEAEIISNKSANNIIRYNTIRDSNGSIVTRHGEGAEISNNFIFGDDNPFSGGIRLVDGEHTVTNNYIEGARFLSSNWNGGIVLTSSDGSGDGESGYQDVENVLIAHNTIVDSVNSLNVFGGNNNTQPDSVYFINNVIADAIGSVIRTNDEGMPANSTFDGNYVYGQSLSDDGTATIAGFTFEDAMLEKGGDGLYRPSNSSPALTAAVVDTGSFTLPTIDMDGQTRTDSTISGADEELTETKTLSPLTADDVGPKNYRPSAGKIYVQKVDIANHDFDSGDLTGWTGTGAEITTVTDEVFSRNNSLKVNTNDGGVSQTVTVTANTNYTLSAFMKGSAQLSVTVDGQTYNAERTSTSYGFSSVTFNSGAGTSAIITAAVDDFITNKAAIVNSEFDDAQDNWTVVEGTGIGQVQDSDNSSSSTNGSIKFKYNDDDSGTPHDPYIAQTVAVEANTTYTFSIYQLLKSSHSGSTIRFGAFSEDATTDLSAATILAEKESVYADLVNAGNDEADDDFFQDTLTIDTGSNTSLTIFAQYQSTSGEEIRVDEFELSYLGAPAEGTEAFFDSIRLVSHPLSEAESSAAESD